MYIHDFFQNFLKTFLVCFHGAFTSSVIAPDMPPAASATKISAEMFFTAIGENACSALGAIESVAGGVKVEEA